MTPAEALVSEILNAYNRRKEPGDLRDCVAIAEKHLRAARGYMQAAVAEFHRKFAVPVRPTPGFSRPELRAELIYEEACETVDAINEGDFTEAVDGLADVLYVVFGAALEFGIDLAPIFDEVHRTNMLKEGGGVRADGKILKPEGWEPPRIAELIEAQKGGSR